MAGRQTLNQQSAPSDGAERSRRCVSFPQAATMARARRRRRRLLRGHGHEVTHGEGGETLALDDDGRPRAFQDTMSRFGSQLPDDGASDEGALLSPFFFDLLHLDGRDLLDEPLQVRLRRRPARQDMAEGQARPHPRPRRDRCRMGVRPPLGKAVEHPPGRARPRRRRAGHGGQDLQGDDRPAAGLADAHLPGARPRARRLGGAPAAGTRRRDRPRRRTAQPPLPGRCRPSVRPSAAVPAGKTPAEADTIDAVRALLTRS
jgi:hypothetical protein